MLNRIIQLQAVDEIITKATGKSLLKLAKKGSKLRTAVYQNRLALEYMLVAEGGICGKF
ncbi:ENR1 protein, partial [Probosciger aterrimus]|nr:ENR1 protein [Probosciger aterrimus]